MVCLSGEIGCCESIGKECIHSSRIKNPTCDDDDDDESQHDEYDSIVAKKDDKNKQNAAAHTNPVKNSGGR